ncbi:MAG: hypothetical protein HYT79_10900 [Elusimicrobia bacterium]|nr:hypothetical protein [Elusimicrobiota bacterium]
MAMAIFFSTPSVGFSAPVPVPIGQVLGIEFDGNTTNMVLEVDGKLVLGGTIYLQDGIPIVIGDLLSQKRNLYYYTASVPKKLKIDVGEKVYAQFADPGTPGETPARHLDVESPKVFTWRKSLRGKPFVPKKVAEITAIQNKNVLIDRGSIHEVDKRDVYAVYDTSGLYKGKIETRGIGDFQSTALFYHPAEEFRNTFRPAIGDKAVFVGRRSPISMGFWSSSARPFRHANQETEGSSEGYGGIWELCFRDGWKIQAHLGVHSDSQKDADFTSENTRTFVGAFSTATIKVPAPEIRTRFFGPFSLTKNFFYPRPISPYLRIGFAFVRSELIWGTGHERSQQSYPERLIPSIGGGIELFSGKWVKAYVGANYFFSPEQNVKDEKIFSYFGGPYKVGLNKSYPTRNVFYESGIVLNFNL